MPLHRRLLPVAVAIVAVGSVATACGDDDTTSAADTTAAATTLTADEFIAQANALCTDTSAQMGEVIGPLFADPSSSADDQQAALDEVVSISRQLGDDIGALAEPAELSDQVDALTAAFDEANDAVASMSGEEFFASDDDPWAAANALADDMGLDACGSDE